MNLSILCLDSAHYRNEIFFFLKRKKKRRICRSTPIQALCKYSALIIITYLYIWLIIFENPCQVPGTVLKYLEYISETQQRFTFFWNLYFSKGRKNTIRQQQTKLLLSCVAQCIQMDRYYNASNIFNNPQMLWHIQKTGESFSSLMTL